MSMFGNKASRNKEGVSWSGSSSSGGSSGDKEKPCNEGGTDHGNNVMVMGHTWHTIYSKEVRYKKLSCKRCGANWEEMD